MIRVGNAILNEDLVAAIRPVDEDGMLVPEEASVLVVVDLAGGQEIGVHATMAEVRQALEQAGVLDVERAVLQLALKEKEIKVLRTIHRENFHFVARDADGKLFAYTAKPSKGKRTWMNDDETSTVLRIRAEIDCLSFEDEEPLDLDMLFAEAGSC